jgi:hypothetical protein
MALPPYSLRALLFSLGSQAFVHSVHFHITAHITWFLSFKHSHFVLVTAQQIENKPKKGG